MKIYQSINEVDKALAERFKQDRIRRQLQKTLAGETIPDADITKEEARAELQKTLARKDAESFETADMTRKEAAARLHKTLSGGQS